MVRKRVKLELATRATFFDDVAGTQNTTAEGSAGSTSVLDGDAGPLYPMRATHGASPGALYAKGQSKLREAHEAFPYPLY